MYTLLEYQSYTQSYIMFNKVYKLNFECLQLTIPVLLLNLIFVNQFLSLLHYVQHCWTRYCADIAQFIT
jgi:hypothetical protein